MSRVHALPVLAVCTILVAAPASAGDFRAVFAKHWQSAREFTLAVAEAMPAESYDFKPTPEQLTFGRLMTHIAAQNSDSCAVATGATAVPEPQVSDKVTAIKYLTETFDACAAALTAMPPARLEAEVYTFQGEPVLAEEALWYTFTHMAHHRGQAEVYLRVKNITPPAWRF
jgi:uncharacterized damage-inducible protein DinB